MTNDSLQQLAEELAHVKRTLGTLIHWVATSAGSPISATEAAQLLRMLDGKDADD